MIDPALTLSGAIPIAIFVVTYVLIATRRLGWLGLDRPAGALFGAVACVVLRVLTPSEALTAVDGATLVLLLGVMGMGAFLAVDGFFDRMEHRLIVLARTPARLLALLVWSAGGLSALITNDAVCVLGTPLVLRIVQKHRLPALPFLLALATAANTGSVATLLGNPQNMLCGRLGGLSYREHIVLMAPIAVVCLAINHGLLRMMFRTELTATKLTAPTDAPPTSRRSMVTLAVIAGSATVAISGADLASTAVAGFVLLMLIHRHDTRQLWPHIDWSILLFFGGLFVVVEGLIKSGVPSAVFASFPLSAGGTGIQDSLRLAGIFLVGSNVVTNVPFILVVRDQMASLSHARLGWELLAMASTFAGNLTLLGSVANIIVAEGAREMGGIGFWQYLRVGLPLAVISTLVGGLWITLMNGNG